MQVDVHLRAYAGICVCLSIAAVQSAHGGQTMADVEPLIKDSFPAGKPELKWVPYPHFNLDNLHGSTEQISPVGEPGVGILDNRNAGGFAALSYADVAPVSDFYLETWIHVEVSDADKGPLNGIAFRIDPIGGNFYRVATQFTAEPRISLAYVGKDTNHFPHYLAVWKDAEIPGGAPRASGWHEIAVQIRDDKAEVYWNGSKLPGGPFVVDRVQSGFIGVYANVVGGLGLAETKIDRLRVWAQDPRRAPSQ